MSLIQINRDNAALYLPKIIEIEAHARYPLGDDSFTIDHGTDYFEFFNRMGSYQYYAWIEDGQVSAVICLVLRQAPLIPIHTTQLALWSLDENAMAQAQPIIEQHRGPIRYLSLKNIKDIVLTSTQAAMPILHAQFGPMADIASSSERDSTAIHMFCSPSADQLTRDLQKKGLIPSSSATILAHRMPTSDWRWMLTSEI